jgi:hypothetical protein
VRIGFTGRNAFGVMDHHVDAGHGPEIHVPMRVVPNGGPEWRIREAERLAALAQEGRGRIAVAVEWADREV